MNKLLLAGATALAFGLSYYMTYLVGHDNGANEITALWEEDKNQRAAEVNKLKGEIAQLQLQHSKVQEELTRELQTATDSFNVAILAARDEFAARLSDSETRAGVYQRQARGSAAEQDRLARHAAELDRSLEEGRALVRELGATLRQREVTIRALGGIILNDRTLLENQHGNQ